MDHKYKEVVAEIKGLNWDGLEPQQLEDAAYLAHASAREFGESLRLALRVHKGDECLAEMARGELKTTNLSFGDYQGVKGDHAEFLDHFLTQAGYKPSPELEQAAADYLEECRKFSPEVRALTIFSREQELSGIFTEILKNPHWSTPLLQAFRYYLERHIELDSADGGHADLVSAHTIDDSVLPFYQTRLKMYQAIPELFDSKQK